MNSKNHDDDATRIFPASINDPQQTSKTEITNEVQKQDSDSTISLPVRLKQEVTANEAATIITKNSVESISEPVSSALKVGSILKNRFILRELLGSGGMGTVFRATDLRRQEARDESPDVAIKVLNDEFKNDPELFIALQRETKKLNNWHIPILLLFTTLIVMVIMFLW